MFDEKTLKELAAITAQGPILSVYLNVDTTQRTRDEYKLELRDLLKQVQGEAEEADIEAIRRYVELEYDWSGRGLVLMSRQAESLWYAFTLAVPVRSGVTVARKPYLSPLVALNSLYGRYVVALIDRQGGRFFLFQMGELVSQEGTVGELVRHVRKGRGSSAPGRRSGAPVSARKEAEVIQRNWRDTIKALEMFCREYHPRRLLLAGNETTIAQVFEMLPDALQKIVGGSFTADMEAGEVEIRDRSFALLYNLAQKRHQELVETVVTAAAKGQNGVVGLDETLSAAHEGRVQVLLVAQSYHEPGYRCQGCGYLTTQPVERCVFCGGEFAEIPDAVEAVVSQTVEKGGTVEVVKDELVGETLIGALLRY